MPFPEHAIQKGRTFLASDSTSLLFLPLSFQSLSVFFGFQKKIHGAYLKQMVIMINKDITLRHKTALSPSSVLLVQWLTFGFMSIFAVASDKMFYYLPPRQPGLNLSGPGRQWTIMTILLEIISTSLPHYQNILGTEQMETSRRDDTTC